MSKEKELFDSMKKVILIHLLITYWYVVISSGVIILTGGWTVLARADVNNLLGINKRKDLYDIYLQNTVVNSTK